MGFKERVVLGSSLLVAIGGGAMSAYASIIVPEYAYAAFWGGCAIILVGICGMLWAIFHKDEHDMSNKDEPVVGTDIQNSGGGIGLDIQSNGTPEYPSFGGESIVQVPQGQSAIGTRIVQNGPGMGMRVVQSGPGVGFRSVVIVGKPDEKT
jgi:hypothetical protein